jgi:hypothetical protein
MASESFLESKEFTYIDTQEKLKNRKDQYLFIETPETES